MDQLTPRIPKHDPQLVQAARDLWNELTVVEQAVFRDHLTFESVRPIIMSALLGVSASPVPPSSADARAKLLELVRQVAGALRDVAQSGANHGRGESFSRCNYCGDPWDKHEPGCTVALALTACELALALPPHEGETPQPAAEPSGWQPIETAAWDEDVLVCVEMPDGRRVVGEARQHSEHGWYWASGGPGDYHASEIQPTHWHAMLLPPVIQTRPEEPTPSAQETCPHPRSALRLDQETFRLICNLCGAISGPGQA